MNRTFTIFNKYLNTVNFDSPVVPNLSFGTSEVRLAVSIDVQSGKAEGTSLFVVTLHVTVKPQIENQEIFKIELGYSALVEILDKNMEEDDLKKILQIEVPQNLYNHIRILVWNLTDASAFPPIMLEDYDFSSQCVSSLGNVIWGDDDNWVFSSENSGCLLGYDWIMKEICSVEEGARFISTFKQITGLDLSKYEELPLYKYYYRFLVPIEYNHPCYGTEECEESFWKLLFQLLFAEKELGEVKIIGADNNIPEIEFTYNNMRRNVSDLTLEELKDIVLELAMHAFTHTCMDIYNMNVNQEYIDKLREDRPLLKEEIFKLYDVGLDSSQESISFAEYIYNHIKECDIQTLPYRF